MNCQKYNELSSIEAQSFLGMLTFYAQADDECFLMAQKLIELAIIKKLDEKISLHNDYKALSDLDNPIEQGGLNY